MYFGIVEMFSSTQGLKQIKEVYMKRFTIAIALVFLGMTGVTSIALGADDMIIHYKNGRTQSIDLNSVQRIEFQGNSSTINQPQSGIYPGRAYQLIAKHSGKCLDVSGVSTANGANIIQYDCHGGPNQQWTLTDKGGGYYLAVAKHSGKCLDVAGVGTGNGTNIIQYDCHSGPNQQWMLIPQGQGYYLATAKHSGKCLDVAGASTGNGANIIQYDCHAGPNQLWMLK